MDLEGKRIVITGGNGFLGSHVCDLLLKKNISPIIIRSNYYDLTQEDSVKRMYDQIKPDVVIHLAAVVGGIGINQKKPGSFYYKNLMMGALLIEYGRINNIEKFVSIGTICSYPKFAPVPFKEEDIRNGYPEETNAPYGLAKKMMLVQLQAYRKEFGFNGIHILPVNLYGPRDNFNLDSSHVIPAIIKKCIDARNNNINSIVCWGSGLVTREFMYVEDAAKGIILATENYDSEEPVNLGTQSEISIKHLVELIAKLTNYKGSIIWDDKYPDGQPRRCLNTDRAKSFGFEANTSLEDGLKQTIDWYERHIK